MLLPALGFARLHAGIQPNAMDHPKRTSRRTEPQGSQMLTCERLLTYRAQHPDPALKPTTSLGISAPLNA
eukprot:12354446-Alexandrium_andersonii.AAC.1